MDGDGLELLVDRLAVSDLSEAVKDVVLAGMEGQDRLDEVLQGRRPPSKPNGTTAPPTPRGLFVSEVAVEGFRGIGGRARLGFRPGPGLALVVGRNGSAKSSFSEGAELALTGTASRWSGRTRVWEKGWANLHHTGPRSVEIRLVEEGRAGVTVVAREWKPGEELVEGRAYVQRPGKPRESPEALGLSQALATWRPFLSYNELGGLLEEGPSKLYDAIAKVLGLDEWLAVETSLDDARKALEAAAKQVKTGAASLRRQLEGLDDDRAGLALWAMPHGAGTGDLAALEALATGEATSSGVVATLEGLAKLVVPEAEVVEQCRERLGEALARVHRLASTDSGRARQLADLLEAALGVHHHSADDHHSRCPVCGTEGALGPDWAAQTAAQVSALRREAADADRAQSDLESVLREARELIGPLPPGLAAAPAGLDTTVCAQCWAAWRAAPQDPAELVAHLEVTAGPLREATERLRAAATSELGRHNDAWSPLAVALGGWLVGAREAEAAAPRLKDLKSGLEWLGTESNRLRNERFAPIAGRVQGIWELLRQRSNVSISAVTLEGTKTRRRVELGVSVDDTPGAALAVMSQGELHALALSLFLPRATLGGSPFRFIMIDDPVQAMDAARVDGLARVLDEVAGTHQVIVFTHDERLPDAVRRLGIPARTLEVSRGLRSEVGVRPRRDPASDYLDDAGAVLATDGYPMDALRRVVPALCRQAVEAACDDATRRRLLAEGTPHTEVEGALAAATKLLPRLALAIFGDSGRAGDALAEVNRRWGPKAGDCVRNLNRGAHEAIDKDPRGLIADARVLALGILELT